MAEIGNKLNVIDVDIEKEMKSSYLDYAMSVIVARALPDVKDGYIEIPTGPGIGIELIPDVEDKFPFQTHKINTRLYEDGSICDQ